MRKQNVNEDIYFVTPELSVGCRVLRIVGVLVLILVVGFTFGIWVNAEGSHGGQTIMKKLNVIDPDKEGPVLDEDSFVFTAAEEYYTEDSEDILPILDKLNVAHYFTYIPPGYELDSLRYSLYTDVPETDDYETLDYSYDLREKPLEISFRYSDYYPIDEETMEAYGLEKYISPITGQCLYISDKKACGEDTNFWYSIRWDFENGTCYIWLEEPKEVGIKIAESIYQYK